MCVQAKGFTLVNVDEGWFIGCDAKNLTLTLTSPNPSLSLSLFSKPKPKPNPKQKPNPNPDLNLNPNPNQARRQDAGHDRGPEVLPVWHGGAR